MASYDFTKELEYMKAAAAEREKELYRRLDETNKDLQQVAREIAAYETLIPVWTKRSLNGTFQMAAEHPIAKERQAEKKPKVGQWTAKQAYELSEVQQVILMVMEESKVVSATSPAIVPPVQALLPEVGSTQVVHAIAALVRRKLLTSKAVYNEVRKRNENYFSLARKVVEGN